MCSEIGHTRQNCPRYATRNNRYIAAAVGDDANPEVRQLAERFSSNNLFHKTVLRVIISKPQQGTKVDTISWNRTRHVEPIRNRMDRQGVAATLLNYRRMTQRHSKITKRNF
nr:uncharacterized protein LOC118683628 isoform X1 [Bactrocera oleae]